MHPYLSASYLSLIFAPFFFPIFFCHESFLFSHVSPLRVNKDKKVGIATEHVFSLLQSVPRIFFRFFKRDERSYLSGPHCDTPHIFYSRDMSSVVLSFFLLERRRLHLQKFFFVWRASFFRSLVEYDL